MTPSLTLAVFGAALLEEDHYVKILEIDFVENIEKKLKAELVHFKPEFIGITCTTPMYNAMVKIARLIKQDNEKIIIIGGGPHASALPEETLKNSLLDVVVLGEGDITIKEIISGQ